VIAVKILVCIDGSANSLKCAEVTARMVEDLAFNEVAFIYVHDSSQFFPDYWQGKYPFTTEEEKQFKNLNKRISEEHKKVFADALKYFENQDFAVDTILKVGHAAEVIAEEAEKGSYDLVVIGRRGTGGVKKLFMGSVSSSVLQLIKNNILIVK
jgi:nucleotide-binding universal stress UspA family protein